MTHPPSRRFLSQAGLVIGAILLSAALQTSAAFTAPNTTPPNANAYAPLTTSPTTQTKQGGINAGDSSFNKIGTNGFNPTSGYPTGWGGGIHTWDVYAEGTVAVGTGGSIAAAFNRDGNAWFNGTTHLNRACFGTSCITAWPGPANVGDRVYECPDREFTTVQCGTFAALPMQNTCLGQITRNATCRAMHICDYGTPRVYSCTAVGHLVP